MKSQKAKTHLEVWGDIVSLNDLTKAIILSSITTMSGYFLAPADNLSLQLFFGLGGALLGFLISTFWIEPKRVITKNGHLTTLQKNKEGTL